MGENDVYEHENKVILISSRDNYIRIGLVMIFQFKV